MRFVYGSGRANGSGSGMTNQVEELTYHICTYVAKILGFRDDFKHEP